MTKRRIDSFFNTKSEKRTRPDSTTPSAMKVTYDHHESYPIPLPSNFPMEIQINAAHKVINDKKDLDLLYYQPLFPAPTAKQLFQFLRDEFCWYRVTYQVRGMTINTPRYTTVFGLDQTHSFVPLTSTTSSLPAANGGGRGVIEVATRAPPKKPLSCTPRPIPGCLLHLKRLVEEQCRADFNFCLLNYYKDGSDSISYHSDDESFLGPDPTIASLSLGHTRDFHMRLKADHGVTFKTPLRGGEMIVMRGTTQSKWDHAVPKRKSGRGGEIGGRINVTFRKAVVRYGTENYYRYNVHDGPYFRWDERQECMVLGSSFISEKKADISSIRNERWEVRERQMDFNEGSIQLKTTLPPQPPPAAALSSEESFDVQAAVDAIDAAAASPLTSSTVAAALIDTSLRSDLPLDRVVKDELEDGVVTANCRQLEPEDSFDLEAQIRAIDEAVERANNNDIDE